MTLLNTPLPRYQYVHLNAKCHEVTLIIELLIVILTYHMSQNRVNDTKYHKQWNELGGGT